MHLIVVCSKMWPLCYFFDAGSAGCASGQVRLSVSMITECKYSESAEYAHQRKIDAVIEDHAIEEESFQEQGDHK